VTDGNFELVQILVSWAVTLPGVTAIVVLDERRLRGLRRDRAWPPVSRDAAIFAMWNLSTLLVLCVPLVHFVRTRRSALGALLGTGWLAVLLAANVAAEFAAAAAVDWLGL
jgi:hypothetical protein